MAKILFYGDNPNSNTANAYMNVTIIKQLEKAGHDVAVIGFSPSDSRRVFEKPEIKSRIVELPHNFKDPFGEEALMGYIQQLDFDFLVTNNDLWRMHVLASRFSIIREQKSIKWIGVFPCDCDSFKPDWAFIQSQMDLPIVYSQHGFNLYCQAVPKLRYWKPYLDFSKFNMLNKKDELKKKIFNLNPDTFLIGVVAKNQFRKDLVRSLEVFKYFLSVHPNAYLYLHTDALSENCGDITAVIQQMNLPHIIMKTQNTGYIQKEMMGKIYNAMDCLLVTSLGEGLCYPIIEAQLCGTPVVGASNTAITELLSDGKGFQINLNNETAPLPIMVNANPVTEQRRRADIRSSLEQLEIVLLNTDNVVGEVVKKANENALTFTKNNDSFNRLTSRLIEKTMGKRNGKQKERVLYCQYASAGDILISTGILENLAKKHGMELDYMTNPIYFDILEGNPNIKNVLEWDMKVAELYKTYVYPHRVIRNGNWGTNDVSLYDVYAQLCEVDYGQMFIQPLEPKSVDGRSIIWENYITIHNQGGHPYRYYPFMEAVMGIINNSYPDVKFIQIGAKSDPQLKGVFDCRGVSFRESAFIIKNSIIHIGVDSFPSHCASAVGKEQVCLFGCGARRVVRPRGMSVNIEPDYLKTCPIIGPCWGNYRGCQRPCIQSLPPAQIGRSAVELIGKVRNV